MNVEPFRWFDLWRFRWQDAQRADAEYVTTPYAMNLEAAGPAFTFWDRDRIVGCGGFVAHGAAAQLWAFLAPDCPMVAMTRAVERAFRAVDFRDLWATCDAEFPQAARWLRVMGFEEVRRLETFTPSHRPHLLFVRDLWRRT